MLPSGPLMGEKDSACAAQPSSFSMKASTSAITSRCTCLSRTTPFLPTRSRPASNCGLMSEMNAPSSPMISAAAGRILVMEMKDTSITPSVGCSGRSSRLR